MMPFGTWSPSPLLSHLLKELIVNARWPRRHVLMVDACLLAPDVNYCRHPCRHGRPCRHIFMSMRVFTLKAQDWRNKVMAKVIIWVPCMERTCEWVASLMTITNWESDTVRIKKLPSCYCRPHHRNSRFPHVLAYIPGGYVKGRNWGAFLLFKGNIREWAVALFTLPMFYSVLIVEETEGNISNSMRWTHLSGHLHAIYLWTSIALCVCVCNF